MDSSPCPSEDRLAALLNENLSPEEFREVEGHVADCAACQVVLERLNAFTWPEWRASEVKPRGDRGPIGSLGEIPGHEIREELGRGGHGVVFRAVDLLLDRPVALKFIKQGALAGEAEKNGFLAEARAAARIQHPHIIAIHSVGDRAGRPYFTMELAAGGGLDRRLLDGPLDIQEAVRLVERLARAVQHAHDRGVLHRDLKPSNILLADETLDEPRIADFGIARIVDSLGGRWATDPPLGTPGYMAPEQVATGPNRIGPAVDIFALGAILYESLAGRPPFRGASPFETLVLTREQEPTPPSELRPGLPHVLELICLKCLRKRPDDRYATAAELADDLRRFLDGETVSTTGEAAVVGARLSRRGVRPAAAAAILLLIPVAAWMATTPSRWGGDPAGDLVKRLRAADPSTIPALRAEFSMKASDDEARVWTALDGLLSERDPGALAAAALVNAPVDDPRWAERAGPLSALLAEADKADRIAWTAQVRPISGLLAGAIADRLADEAGEGRDARSQAARLLLELTDADAAIASNLSRRLADLSAPMPEETVVERAKGAGNLGAALILAGDDRFARPLLIRSPHPTARARLIASMGRDRGELGEPILDRAGRDPDPGARQALLLALARPGAPPGGAIPLDAKTAVEKLRRFYRDDPDSGVHGAAEWILIRWDQLPLMRLERNMLAEARPPGQTLENRGWYVGPRRHTLAILRPPSGRAFALATTEASALQLQEFLTAHPNYQPEPIQHGLPAHPVPLFMARAYCNWLGLQDGLEDELCYEPGPGDSFEPVDGFLDRLGYRLPTEDEWLFACWGEAATPFPHGRDEELFEAYGRASADAPLNVSRFMPNDRGLFDMLGNASEWCETPAEGSAIARGGSFLLPPSAAPTYRSNPSDDPEAGRTVGFRVARTLPGPSSPATND